MQTNVPSCSEKIEERRRIATSEELVPRESKIQRVKSSNSTPINDARLCKICYVEELGVVFLPCGHLVTCVKCASCMLICSLCRKPISMTVRTFFS